MDLENQKRVLALTEEHGAENIVVLLGAAEGEASGLAAETVTNGDPTFAGPLTGVSLGLTVYHVCEPEVKAEFDEAIYEDQVGMMEMVLEAKEKAKNADVALVFVGLTDEYETEGNDRSHINLPPIHNTLVEEVLKVNPTFKQWAEEHTWCVTIIEDFDGDVRYEVDDEDEAHIVGEGNISFYTTQTGI